MSICIDGGEISSFERQRAALQIRAMATSIFSSQSRRSRQDDAEPSLSELIDDPVIHVLMARDGVGCADLVGAIDVARARLGLGPWAEAPCGPAAAEARPSTVCCG